jgi:acid phosphatase
MNLRKYDHIVVVIEENRSLNDVIGKKDAPYMNQLAQKGILFTNSHFSGRPSQPNYIVLFSGYFHEIFNNEINPKINAPNLYTALNKANKTFLCYSEDLPYVGYDEARYKDYVRKHNPVPQFINVPHYVNQPFTNFPSDFNQLPTVSFVIPNQQHNAHDGTLYQADEWLYNNISRYAEWAVNNNSLLIVTFDEADTDSSLNEPIPTIFYGAGIPSGIYSDYIDHTSILRFILDTYGAKL